MQPLKPNVLELCSQLTLLNAAFNRIKSELALLIFFSLSTFSLSSNLFPSDWQYHPDKQSADVPAGELEERAQRFIEVDQAWKILGNEETKREYDLQRRGRFCREAL